MGGIYLQGRRRDGSALDAGILAALDEHFPAVIREPSLRPFCRTVRDETLLQMQFHPSAEAVEFFFDDEQRLVCSAKTNTCGPGYHAYLIDMRSTLRIPSASNSAVAE